MQRWRVLHGILISVLFALVPCESHATHAVFTQNGIDVWAVGDNGLVHRSLDGGDSYVASALGATALRGVAARGLTAIVVGDSGKIWRSTDNGGAWTLHVVAGAPQLFAVTMPGAEVAYVAGAGGLLLRSDDDGATWSPLTSGTSSALLALAFASDLDGWAAGAGGVTLRTTNGGGLWSPVTTGATHDLLDVAVNGTSVWVVGDRGTAWKSADGGQIWDPVDLQIDAPGDVRAVCLATPDSVVLAGGGGYVRVSADAGATWTFPAHALHGAVGAACMRGSGVWVATADTMAVMHSADGGATWAFPTGTTITRNWVPRFDAGGVNDKRGSPFSVNAQNPRTIYCMLVNQVYASRDEGETWQAEGNPDATSLRVNAFVVSPKDSNEFVAAVTNPDRIIRSDDGGQTWSTRMTADFGEYGTPVEMDPDHPDTLYFGIDNGVLQRSVDFGKAWLPFSTTVFRSPCDIIVVPGSDSATVMVGDGVTGVGNGQVWRATQGSTVFNLQYSGVGTSSEIPAMATTRLRHGDVFITSWSGPDAQVSKDEGLTWSSIAQLVGVPSTWGTDIAKDDPNVVLLGRFSGGLSYLSLDGGVTWDGFPIGGSNYGTCVRDRGLMLQLQSSGIWRMRTTYRYVPSTTQDVAVTAPNGGETWLSGEVHAIMWDATNVALAAIEYRRSPAEPWVPIASVPGYVGTYDWTVPDDPTTEAVVRVRDAWHDAPSDTSDAFFTLISQMVAVEAGRPVAFALGQNRPNPFHGATTLNYTLPIRTPVALEVFDLQGKRVATLVRGIQDAGAYTVPFGAGRGAGAVGGALRSGVYFLRLRAGGFTATRKMLLMR